MVNVKNVLIMTMTAALALTGCSKKAEIENQPLELISGDLFSNRPINVESVVVLLKLDNPSLIESGTYQNGVLEINEEAKAALLAEQAETVAKAKALSDDVRLLFSYKFALNGVALSVPLGLYDQVETLGTVARAEKEVLFERPVLSASQKKAQLKALQEATEIAQKKSPNPFAVTSVTHIGADQVHAQGFKGKGVKVGIIDTGVDFTHKMLGGNGDVEAFKTMDKEKETPLFPNQKVVGGYDFTGPDYSPGSILKSWRIPRPDVNPMDEGGHGTHVAGSVAGIGDGVNTYDGVAPEADIYALKVFGNNGGTSDTVVIAAMEWAMDPNQDMDPSDRLDVLNLSLGGGFGKPNILYSLAVKNLAKVGIISVMSAGNSGATPFITGAPGTSEDGLSVGASVDGMEKNWTFDATKVSSPSLGNILERRFTASFAPLPSEVDVKGKLVYVGDATSDFDQATIDQLNGHVALIDRGGNPFVEKVNRAEAAGAIAVVIANNQPGSPIFMGGEGKAGITAVMVSQDTGVLIKDAMAKGEDVVVEFTPEEQVKTPEVIDTITGFSSQGPRSEDGLIKPEIVAPGFQIISASAGEGDKGVALNGTSMSAPHMAGVMALLKQAKPSLNTAQAKALVMNTATPMKDEAGNTYSVTRQGAGLVNPFKAVSAKIIATPAALSLGTFQLEEKKAVRKELQIFNTTNKEKTLEVTFKSTNGTKNIAAVSKTVTVPALTTQSMKMTISMLATKEAPVEFHEGHISIKEGNEILAVIPVLGVSKRLSRVATDELKVYATAQEDAIDALAELKLSNKSQNTGVVEVFNLLGTDKRKPTGGTNADILSRSCDLQAVGYRIVKRNDRSMLQIGMKIYAPVSNWQACELSVRIDGDGDGEADQEIGGLPHTYLSGLAALVPAGFYSVLLDHKKAVQIRTAYEQNIVANEGRPTTELSYVPALLDVQLMKGYANSNLAILELDLANIARTDEGRIRIKPTMFNEGGIEYEDNLQERWFTISPQEREQSFRDIPEAFTLAPGESKTVELTKGFGSENLMIASPTNLQIGNRQTTVGAGLEIVKPTF